MNNFMQFLRNLGPTRLVALGSVILAFFIFFSFLIARFSNTDMALLYADLDLSDSSQIVNKLESMDIPFQIKNGGQQIFVPGDQLDRLRLLMAQEGIPQGGSIGYEIFDRSETFGVSSFVQNINHVRALEGELSRTISSLKNVSKSRVHLVLGKREIFDRQTQEPRASIILKMQGSHRLSRSEVQAVQHLVAAAVPGLNPTQISIIDDRGTLLARGGDENSSYTASHAEEMRMQFQQSMRRSVEDMLERTVGVGKVRVEVQADLDYDHITTSEENYDPESKVTRSTQTSEETSNSVESDGAQTVTVENDIPGGAANAADANKVHSRTNRTDETVNYEISKILKNTVKEVGNIKKLSIAVLVDGTYIKGADNTEQYTPRDAQTLTQIKNLVQSAVGYDEKRGDIIEIVNMQFVKENTLDTLSSEEGFLSGFLKNDLLKMVETLGLAFIGFLVLLLVVRPVLVKIFDFSSKRKDTASYLPAGDTKNLVLPSQSSQDAPETDYSEENIQEDKMIDLEQVSGKVKASVVKQVTNIVDNHPEEAMTVVRNWLHEGS